ncbi:MAG: flagellar protein FlgN [Ignavibacteriales bacterium]|nr:flagellar protein FlgN [Ignavibacteriales bacterium]
MKKTEELAEILESGAGLAETMLDILKAQQQAIVQFQSAALGELLEKQQSLVKPMEIMEKKRQDLTIEIGRMSGAPKETRSLKELVETLEKDEAAKIQKCGNRLHAIVEQVLTINNQNKVLLENSLRFIQRNLRIITSDYSRKFVDAKI